MTRRAIVPPGASSIGPYSPAIRAGAFLFISGQIPLDPKGGGLLPGPIEAQTQRCLEQIKEILAATGGSLADLVKVTIYLANMNDFDAVNRAYATYFGAEPPARACIGVAALPKGAPIEIEAIAYLGERGYPSPEGGWDEGFDPRDLPSLRARRVFHRDLGAGAPSPNFAHAGGRSLLAAILGFGVHSVGHMRHATRGVRLREKFLSEKTAVVALPTPPPVPASSAEP